MSQHDMVLANAVGAAFRADANVALGALASKQAGNAAPPISPLPTFCEWVDSSTAGKGVFKLYSSASWLPWGTLDTANAVWMPVVGGGTGTIASATTTDLATKDETYISVTGTTTITGLGTVGKGIIKVLSFAASLTFTHNGTSLILPGAKNITTRAGDIAIMESLGAGNWTCLSYTSAAGLPNAGLLTEATLASAATTNLGSAASNIISVTGTTTITSFGSGANTDSPLYFVRFAGALTLTHNGTSLILPGAANYTTAAGDALIAQYLGSGNWRVLHYTRAAGGADVNVGICNGRLTLTSGVPVTSADVTAATNVYFTPCNGNRIALYSSGAWVLRSFTEITHALGTVTSGLPYDFFAYDNAGTVAVEKLAWTNGTTRATALALQDGVYIKSGDATRRYIGTIYTTSTTTTENSFTKRFVYNHYNKVKYGLYKDETAASWTYTTETFRQMNNNAANKVELIIGVQEHMVSAAGMGAAKTSAGTPSACTGIGINSTSVHLGRGGSVSIGSSIPSNMITHYEGMLAVGYNYIALLEAAQASGTCTWYGNGYTGTLNTSVPHIIAHQIM